MVGTVAGTAGVWGSVDGIGAVAQLYGPRDLAVDDDGTFYVSDSFNHVIRRGRLAIPDRATIDSPTGQVGVTRQLDVTPLNATSFQWRAIRVPAGTSAPLSDPDVRNPTFVPFVPGRYEFQLTASNAAGTSISSVALEVAPPVPTASVDGGGVVCGQAEWIYVTLTGTPPWSVTWSDGVTQSGITSSPAWRMVTPPATTVYTVTAVSDAYGIPGTSSGSATVTVTEGPGPVQISRPAYVCEGSDDNEASVADAGPGATYSWSMTNGTITAGAGTRSVKFSPWPIGNTVLSVQVTKSSCTLSDVQTIPRQKCGSVTPRYTFTTFAGSDGGPGVFDGVGSEARFNAPTGVATDAAGNVFVADQASNTIRRVTPAGVVSTLAGLAGFGPGSSDAHRFLSQPFALVMGESGNLYVAESSGAIRRVTPAGVLTTLAGRIGATGSADGPGADARFSSPRGIARDSAGNFYVADTGNHTIRKITPEGTVTTLAGQAGVSGGLDGLGSAARFSSPMGIVSDAAGNLFVADTGNYSIRKITPSGEVTTLAGQAGSIGDSDGAGTAARFRHPSSIARDLSGNLYVTEQYSQTIRRITPAGEVTTYAGELFSTGADDGATAEARFYNPSGVAMDAAGNAWICEAGNHTLRRITAGVVTTVAGKAAERGRVDGVGVAARFDSPSALGVDRDGNVFVGDTGNDTVRKVSSDGETTTIAGMAGVQGAGDGTGGDARFTWIRAVTVDGDDNVFVADGPTIRKITPDAVVTTVAGQAGELGSSDGPGSEARFNNPEGLTADGQGNVYIADMINHTIRKLTPDSVVTTIAGQAGAPGTVDGSGEVARFRNPYGISAGADGTLYVSDTGNSTIRRLNADGSVNTFVGQAGSAWYGDGTGASVGFSYPRGISADPFGNLFIADTANDAIRKVTPSGVASTLAGYEEFARTQFRVVEDVAVASDGTVYVAHASNHSIRVGRLAIPDTATIDVATGTVGEPRQLDAQPVNATSWEWRLIRVPSASGWPALSATNIRNPTFTPDVPGRFEFLLTATNSVGTSITVVAVEATGACQAGDVNDNGSITALDASMILQIVVGSLTPDDGESCAADFNDNGSITALDASAILQCVVGTGPCS